MIRRIIHTVGELFITAGVFLLLFVTWQLWWTTVVADQQNQKVTNALSKEWGDDKASTAQTTTTAPPPRLTAPKNEGAVMGILHIPRFGADWDPRPIVQGTTHENLKHGVGHYYETVMPGQVGNFAMAGHRTTYGAPFNRIAKLKKGDAIIVELKQGWFVYRVSATEIVNPSQISVVAPVPDQPNARPTQRYLTMTSCHPMYSASQRYIVHALLQSFTPRANGKPVALTQGS